MKDKLNKFRWFVIVLLILWISYIGLEEVIFNEQEHYNKIEEKLIFQYFDENINETVYVYLIGEEVFYNITNHDSNSTIVCYFNDTLGYCSIEGNCGYNEYSPIHCYKV